ncbi:MAG: MarR family transcriptional regulator [Solirubrobacteraceae bacterium]
MNERQVGYELRLAEQAWRKTLEPPLRELGLTVPQYSTLRALQRTPGATSAELARSAFVTPQTMNAIVLQLEEARLIERTARTSNLRARDAKLTPAGAALFTKARRLVHRIETGALTGLGQAGGDELVTLLECFTAALEGTGSRPAAGA